MAINSVDVSCEDITLESQGSSSYFKPSCFKPNRLIKNNTTKDESICCTKNRQLRKNWNHKSPYISEDNVRLISRLTEKRFVNKRDSDISSPFPFCAKLYKANSDEFKRPKKNKKMQKSVLTLPNKPAPMPLLNTVSDMTESEYFHQDNDIRKKSKKRTTNHNRKCPGRDKGYEYYDRDALYCSQMDIHLDCSSSDTIKNYDGDRKRTSNSIIGLETAEEKINSHDVWTVLRNINRFQFRQSPQISEDSFTTRKKIKSPKRRNRKDMRIFETRTEEFAYISSVEIDKKSPTFSQSSSFDKITVIDKKTSFSKLCKNLNSKNNNGEKPSNIGAYPKNVKKIKNNTNNIKPNMLIPLGNTNQCYSNLSGDSYIVDRENKKLFTDNGTVRNGYPVKNTEKYKDYMSMKLHTSQASQCCGVMDTGNLGSNKTRLVNHTTNQICREPTKLTRLNINKTNNLDQQINGITKVVLGKGENQKDSNKHESAAKKHKQITTMLSRNVIIPKHTQTAINRRLIKQQYPIVILGPDQLSSSFEVVNQEHIQFDGMDEKVWPFMLQWYRYGDSNKSLKTKIKYSNEQNHKLKHQVIGKYLLPKSRNEANQSILKDKTCLNYFRCANTTKIDLNKRLPVPLANILNRSQTQTKAKPIQQLRDRMIKLLYKKSSVLSVIDGSHSTDNTQNANDRQINIGMCTPKPVKWNGKNTKTFVGSPTKPTSSIEKRTWAKAKWASDFIDNIIKKIKTGAYYTHDSKIINEKTNFSEVEIQTIPTCDIHADESIHALTIPGFDTILPDVQIQTLNMNEISVKHCMTNILVHFDVTILTEPIIDIKKSTSLIPIDGTETHTKIFKCKSSILNAMLPAELCSIFPKMLRNILESGEQLSLPPIQIDKTCSHLSTITEVTRCESPVEICGPFRQSISLIHHVPMSRELWQLLQGRYKLSEEMFSEVLIFGKTSLFLKYDRPLNEQLMPRLSRTNLFNYEVDPLIPMTLKSQGKLISPKIAGANTNTCRALQPYSTTDRKLLVVTTVKKINHTILFETITSLNTVSLCSNVIDSIICCNPLSINFIMRHSFYHQDTVSLSVGNFTMDYPLNDIFNFLTKKLDKTPNCGDCIDSNISKQSAESSVEKYVSVKKIRRKRFVRLYKKCKSASSIAGEKPTPLSKITDLDDFFHVLGSGKLLSSIFDNQSGKKIMSSIQEIKNWTSEINPRQAFLVLLLANKKDTSNLLRYRPLILQGIAVKRITKANELDMEIEVIEREHLNTFSQYEGITYLPASIENQDNLFEELCWIAKNTASDYQKPFDESSEKLLKSLLEKRKKLNPSYLRVMARYVGLGLLKSPGKK